MRGRALPLSGPRRLVGDLMWLSMRVPRVTVQRQMQLEPVVRARAALMERPPWTAIFVRAYGLLSQEIPELRRAYVKLPWPQLYEYPESVAAITFERQCEHGNVVLQGRIKTPEQRSLAELAAIIREGQTRPVSEIKEFRLSLRLARWPAVIRRSLMATALNVGRQRPNFFGTFHLSVYSGLGAESLNPLSPLTTILNYGPIDSSGTVNVRILYDHRVMDGATVARALRRLEAILNERLSAELVGLQDIPLDRVKAAIRRPSASEQLSGINGDQSTRNASGQI